MRSLLRTLMGPRRQSLLPASPWYWIPAARYPGCPQLSFTAFGSSFPTAQLASDGSGFYVVDCGVANSPGSIDYTFLGKTISVTFKDSIQMLDANTCIIGAQSTADDQSNLLLASHPPAPRPALRPESN